MAANAVFPADWLPGLRPAGDLDLALLLVNSLDLLADPPDRLQDLAWLRAAFTEVGHADLAAQLDDSDLPGLRALRNRLRPAFASTAAEQVADALNPLLAATSGAVLVKADGQGQPLKLQVGHGLTGVEALAARLPAAVAAYVAAHGTHRLGTCASDPCRCAFIDRTRAGTRRYCCDYCNDRAASRAYRRRRSQTA